MVVLRSMNGCWRVPSMRLSLLFVVGLMALIAPYAATAAEEQQLLQQQDVLSNQYTWASLVDGSIGGSLQSSSTSETEVNNDLDGQQQLQEIAAIETSNEAEVEADAEDNSEANVDEQSEGALDADSEQDASVDSDASSDESLESEFTAAADSEVETEGELDADTSAAILVELSEHMDVSAILEHEEHQQLYKPKAASSAAPTAAATSTSTAAPASSSAGPTKSARAPAATRLTKDAQAAKFKAFTTKRNRKYASPTEAATAFQTFSKNREAIVALNDKTAASRPAVFKSSGPFADKAPGQFAATRTNSKIQLSRANGKAVRIKRKNSSGGSSSSSTTSSGHTAGMSGGVAGQSGKTGGQSGKTGGQSGKTGGQSGKTGGQSGKTGGQSGKTGGQSGKTGGQSGKTGGQSGKTGGQSGKTGGKSGKTAADSGQTATKSGKNGGKSGKNGGKSGKNGGKSGKNGGSDIALQPVLPPTKGATNGKPLPSDIGITADGIKAGMKAAGVSDADIQAAFDQLKGEYKKGGDIGMDLFGYQKGDCGSCWAHAAGDALTRLWKKQQMWISNELIAVQQALDCVHTKDSNGCKGGSPMDALDYWTNNPIALLKEYPLMDHTGQCKAAPFGGRPNYKAAFGWEMSLPPCSDNKGDCKGQIGLEHLLLKWLKGNSLTPIVYLDASQWQHYSGGVFPLSACSSSTAKGNHIVQIVGYGTDTASGVPYWVIRNSWSRSWGEDGQIRIPFGVNACGVMNFVISVSDPSNDLVNELDVGSGDDPMVHSNSQMNPSVGKLSSRDVENSLTKSEIIARMQVKANENLSTDSRTFQRNSAQAQKQFDQVQQQYANLDNTKQQASNVKGKKTDTGKARQQFTAGSANPLRDAASQAKNQNTGLSGTDAQAQSQSTPVQAGSLTQQQTAVLQATAMKYVAGAVSARAAAGIPAWNAQERAAQLQQIQQIIATVQQSVGADDANMSKTVNALLTNEAAQLFSLGGSQNLQSPAVSNGQTAAQKAALDQARQQQLQRAMNAPGTITVTEGSDTASHDAQLRQAAQQSGNTEALKGLDLLAKVRAENAARQAAYDAQMAAAQQQTAQK